MRVNDELKNRNTGRKSNKYVICDFSLFLQVQDLKYATLATVSRCGMVWFSEDVLSVEMIFENYLSRLSNIPVEETEEDIAFIKKTDKKTDDEITPTLQVRSMAGKVLVF